MYIFRSWRVASNSTDMIFLQNLLWLAAAVLSIHFITWLMP